MYSLATIFALVASGVSVIGFTVETYNGLHVAESGEFIFSYFGVIVNCGVDSFQV